jgi:tetratricopeptide (TPR) repeat protein
VENDAALTVGLAALTIAMLVLVAHDWARRQLMIVAVVAVAALGLFFVRIGYESLSVPPRWEQAQIAAQARAQEKALEAQHRAARAGLRTAVTQIDPSALDRAICVAGGDRIRPGSGKCATGGPDAITSNRAWVTAQHDLDVELASYRAAVTGTAADEAALRKVLAQPAGTDADVTLLAAIENGPETLWGSVFQTATPPLVPGPLGWVILGALLLGLLEWLLMVNARQLAGPVEIVPGKNDKERLVAVLRVAVLQNVAEPGVAPGAPSPSPVTTLLSIAGAAAGPVAKIVQTVLTVVGRRYGYQVSMDVTSEAAATSGTAPPPETRTGTAGTATAASPAGITTVLVRVASISGGVTLASRVFTGPDDEDAVQAAGLWAAGDILCRSSRIPSWAEWNADTASARVLANTGTHCTIDELKSALRAAPNSGLLLARLGHCYELAGRRTDAIGCYARAVAAHPHYWVARYRLAAALGTMRHDAGSWVKKQEPDKRDDMRPVEPATEALQVRIGSELDDLKAAASAEEAREAFRAIAVTLFTALDRDTRYLQRVLGALRRSERDLTWPTLVPPSTSAGRRFHPLVVSALRSLGDDRQLRKLRASAGRPQSGWQISYNGACGYASSIDPPPVPDADQKLIARRRKYAEQALCLLEQTLVRPGIHQLPAEWVKEDAALSSIAASPRFKRFVDQLRPGD